MMTALYFHHMRHDPKNPKWEDRDRFILSKGHVCPALYSVMAESGYFPVSELMTFRQLGTRLQGHPAMQYLPGLEMTAGSLGQVFRPPSEWRLRRASTRKTGASTA
jgi:transketolase